MKADEIEVYAPYTFDGDERLYAISDIWISSGVAEIRVIDFYTGAPLGTRSYQENQIPVRRVHLFA